MPKQSVQFTGGVQIHRLVSDMKRSIDFYVTVLGFFFDHGIREMAWLTRDNLLLTLSPDDGGVEGVEAGTLRAGFHPECGYFGWRLDGQTELEEAYKSFYERHLSLSAPPEPDQGRPWFFLYDPDGYPISFSCVALDYPQGKLG